MTQMPDQNGQGTQSLSRAVAALAAVADGHRDLASIGRTTGTSRSTTHRLVAFLQRAGFIRHVEGRGYLLGARLIELGAAALAQMPLIAAARPVLERLSRQTGYAIYLSVRNGDHVIYVDKIPGSRGLEMRSGIGSLKLMAVTGTGKAQMLDLPEEEWAHLYSQAQAQLQSENRLPPGFLPWNDFLETMRDFRRQGFTMEAEENEESLCSVAAPIRDARGAIIAGLGIASTLPYMPRQRMTELTSTVKASAEAIARELGYVPDKTSRR